MCEIGGGLSWHPKTILNDANKLSETRVASDSRYEVSRIVK